MKKSYRTPSLCELSSDDTDILRTSGLFDPQNATETQTRDDYLAGFGVKAGIGKYTK